MKKVLYYLLFCFIAGIIFTLIAHTGLWANLKDGLKLIPFWAYVLLFIGVFYITLTAHELGHLLSFVISGVQIRALYITAFIFYKKEEGWRFTVKPKMFKLLGGIVFPNLPEVTSDEDYNSLVKKFSNALRDGPLATFVFLIVIAVSFLSIFIWSWNPKLIGYSFIIFIFSLFFSILYLLSSKVSAKNLYGDFVAHEKMKNDELFQLTIINQYLSFSLNVGDGTFMYLSSRVKEIIKITNFSYSDLHIMSIYQAYLIYFIEGHIGFDIEVDKKLLTINHNRLLTKDDYLGLTFYLAYYFYETNNLNKAYQIIESLYNHLNSKEDDYYDYLKSYIDWTFNFSDEEFNRDYEHYGDDQYWIYDIIYIDREIVKKPLDKKIYETEIICYLEK